jgi:hypothetical protein
MAKTTRLKAGSNEGAVRVVGLNETVAALKALENGSEVAVRLAGKAAATEVAGHASSAAYSLGGVAAHVAPSIKASAGIKSAGVALSGDAAMGAEFGGQGRPTTQQFKPWLGHTGYFLYPTIRRDSDSINEKFRTALDAIIREAGLA